MTQIQLIEKVESAKCEFLLTLKKPRFDHLFPKSNEDKINERDFSYYSVMDYCRKSKSNNFKLQITYKRSCSNQNTGRWFAQNGLQNMRGSVRKFLTENIYRDYDIVNAHPCIMLKLCERHDLPCENLRGYCSNRERFLTMACVDKTYVLKIFNSDRIDYFVKNRGQQIRLLAAEVLANKKQLFEIYKNDFNYNREKNPISSLINALWCEEENKYLQRAVAGRRVGVLMFDGFMSEENILVGELSCDDVDWTEKENKSDVKVPDEIITKTYEFVKNKFEKDMGATKISNPPCYIVKKHGSRPIFKKADFLAAFEDMKYKVLTINGVEERKFLTRWIDDEQKQMKWQIGSFPNAKKCPEHVYNLWEPFAVLLWGRSEYSYDEDAVNMYLEHLKSLCNYELNVYNFLILWIAHMFQKTDVKPGVMPLLLGQQGVGKDLALDVLAAIMGQGKRFESVSPDVDVFGQFNSALVDALLIQLSEINKSHTAGSIGQLNSFITAPTIRINEKYKTNVVVPSYHRYICTSNNEEPITIQDHKQRRFIVAYADNRHRGDSVYFDKLGTLLHDKNGLMSIYEYFNERVSNVPTRFTNIQQYFSSFQRDMQLENKSYIVGFLQWMVAKQTDWDLPRRKCTNPQCAGRGGVYRVGSPPATCSACDYECICYVDYKSFDLYYDFFVNFLSEIGVNRELMTPKRFGDRLTAMCVNYSIEKYRRSTGAVYRIHFDALQKEFDKEERADWIGRYERTCVLTCKIAEYLVKKEFQIEEENYEPSQKKAKQN